MRPATRPMLVMVMGLLALWVGAVHAAEPALDGVYASNGVNPDGKPYRGFVRIEHHGDTFIVRWMFARRAGNEGVIFEQASVGVGIMSGGVLAVSYYAEHGAGLAVYRVEEGGRTLVGQWTTVGDSELLSPETLTRLDEVTPPPPAVNPPAEPAPAPSAPRAPRRPVGTAL